MKTLTYFIAILFILDPGFSDVRRNKGKILKTELINRRIVEPPPSPESAVRNHGTAMTYPNHIRENSAHFTLIDSSMNGYGMYSPNTHPLYVTSGGEWLFAYRQWVSNDFSHGMVGCAYSENGEDWTVFDSINESLFGTGGRYPSVLGSPEFPYVFWNEYSGMEDGGTPHYSFDEYGWGGGSFITRIPFLPEFPPNSNLWVGSPGISFEGSLTVINTVFDDWTRNNFYIYTGYADEYGYLEFNPEVELITDTEFPPFSNPGFPVLTMNDDGIGMVGFVESYHMEQSDDSYRTFLFKMTSDHGTNWHGPESGDNEFYAIPDYVFEWIIQNDSGSYTNECDGTVSELTDYWLYPNYDLKLDSEGNPHILIPLLRCDESFCYFESGDGSDIGTGWYHFTIDKDYIENPGLINTPTGWNYSYVVNGGITWNFDDPEGGSFLWTTHAQLAFSRGNPDVVWVVADLATVGPLENYDPVDPYDCYPPYETYPEWSEDIYVFKSLDNGATWWNPLNATPTPNLTEDCETMSGWCSPEEQFPHAFQWGTDDEVYFVFQMPDWEWNEIGDPLGADHMNRLYAGWVNFDEDNNPPYMGAHSLTVTHNEGWNMVGLPMDIEHDHYTEIYPGAIENTLFAFEDGYVQVDTMELGKGYWLRFSDETETVLTGILLTYGLLHLSYGWNIVSIFSDTVYVEDIIDNDGIIVPNTWYGYGAGFVSTNVLIPGHAYWVRASADGWVTIPDQDSRSQEKTPALAIEVEQANILTFGNQSLYFGNEIEVENLLSFSLPPKPLVGGKDIRFSGDTKLCTSNECLIEIMNDGSPLTFECEIKEGESWVLVPVIASETKWSAAIQLNDQNQITLDSEVEQFILRKSTSPQTPTEFVLLPAHPNPFNPVTTIQFSIPDVETQHAVSIQIFDINGKFVRTLVNEKLSPGNHSVRWDGSRVSSGIYFVKLTEGEKHFVRKLMLLK